MDDVKKEDAAKEAAKDAAKDTAKDTTTIDKLSVTTSQNLHI